MDVTFELAGRPLPKSELLEGKRYKMLTAMEVSRQFGASAIIGGTEWLNPLIQLSR